ncbi:hypothetical protein R1sor_007874 [Riccia sorocarpa]|uniref:N-acetyltransferase domain-containing protein n=1 Tax=Riccia sorocarpa TaxID=122646 RepID=A0ABD3HS33_9MARC
MDTSIPSKEDSTTVQSVSADSIPPPRKTLTGKRIILKPPDPEDDGPLCAVFSDLKTMAYLPQFHRAQGWTLDEMTQYRLETEDEYLQGQRLRLNIHFLEKTEKGGETSTVAGITGFKLKGDGRGEFGIILHHPFWRKGVNTEASYLLLQYGFEGLGLTRIDWYTRSDNVAMRKWCEDLGMEAYEVPGLEMGESVGFSLSHEEWISEVRHLLEQRLS